MNLFRKVNSAIVYTSTLWGKLLHSSWIGMLGGALFAIYRGFWGLSEQSKEYVLGGMLAGLFIALLVWLIRDILFPSSKLQIEQRRKLAIVLRYAERGMRLVDAKDIQSTHGLRIAGQVPRMTNFEKEIRGLRQTEDGFDIDYRTTWSNEPGGLIIHDENSDQIVYAAAFDSITSVKPDEIETFIPGYWQERFELALSDLKKRSRKRAKTSESREKKNARRDHENEKQRSGL